VRLDALVLFGSRARDDAAETSDWDLAVISHDFDGLNPLERALLLIDCLAPGIEFVHLTPTELENPVLSYLRCAILEEGVPLVDRGAFESARARYENEKAAGRIRFEGALVKFELD
jgi:predicted nucleotidyltransferase